ncbi:hypothetical protein ES703_13375 [subsurface metagenome]
MITDEQVWDYIYNEPVPICIPLKLVMKNIERIRQKSEKEKKQYGKQKTSTKRIPVHFAK